MLQGREGLAAAVLGGRLYALGGVSSIRANDSLKTVECYDAEKNVWETVADMSTERWGGTAAVLDDKLFVMGGRNARQLNLASVEYYERASNEWKQVAPMNKGRYGHAAAVWNGRLYVMGGAGAGSSVESYDTERDEWVLESSGNEATEEEVEVEAEAEAGGEGGVRIGKGCMCVDRRLHAAVAV